MNLPGLPSPIRIYWDIGPSGSAKIDYGKIAGEIVSSKILMTQVTELSPSLSRPCIAVLEALATSPVALSLVAPLSALDEAALRLLRSLPLKTLFASTESHQGLAFVSELNKRQEAKHPIGLSFPVQRTNFRLLPEVVTFCGDSGISNLLLPMQRLSRGEECFSFSREERRELTGRLQRAGVPLRLKITIHDPFLWRAFYPKVDFPNGGCQAANTMIYISPEAAVFPCPSLPIQIGNLQQESLQDLLRSGEKREIRKRLLSTPAACIDCADLGHCRGGCRGRAVSLSRTFEAGDPACK